MFRVILFLLIIVYANNFLFSEELIEWRSLECGDDGAFVFLALEEKESDLMPNSQGPWTPHSVLHFEAPSTPVVRLASAELQQELKKYENSGINPWDLVVEFQFSDSSSHPLRAYWIQLQLWAGDFEAEVDKLWVQSSAEENGLTWSIYAGDKRLRQFHIGVASTLDELVEGYPLSGFAPAWNWKWSITKWDVKGLELIDLTEVKK